MSTKEVAAQFDQISQVYDSTRDPLDPTTLDSLEAALHRDGVRRILEVGVGTGRIAHPLTDRGFEVVGVDASWGMLGHARAKGLPALVRGSAYTLPFRDQSFDATLFVHVLHVLEAPERALAEAVRVSRRGAYAVVRPKPAEAASETDVEQPRRRVAEELRKAGFDVKDGGGPMRADRRLLATFPPEELRVLSDREVTEPLARRLESVARRGNRHTLTIPESALAAAVATVRAEVGDREITYRRVEALANWSRAPEAPATSPAGLGSP